MTMFEEVTIVSVPIEGGMYLRLGALLEMADVLDGMPDNTLLEVIMVDGSPTELRFEGS